MNDCPAHLFGCGCVGRCRCDIVPPKRENALWPWLMAAVLVGIMAGYATYLALERIL